MVDDSLQLFLGPYSIAFFFSRSALAKEVDALQDELLRRDIEFETATSQIMADYETLYSEKLARSKETLRVELEASSRAERGIAIEAAKKEARGAAQADLAAKVSRKGGRPNSPGGKEQATGAKIEF